MDPAHTLLTLRTALSFIALVYSILIITQTRRILSRPWAFVYIFIRVLIALALRAALLFQIPLPPYTADLVKVFAAFLDLLTLRAIHRAYRGLFPESP